MLNHVVETIIMVAPIVQCSSCRISSTVVICVYCVSGVVCPGRGTAVDSGPSLLVMRDVNLLYCKVY